MSQTKYTWRDVKSIDSNGWHCAKSNESHYNSTLDFVLDTISHEISRLVFYHVHTVDSGTIYEQSYEVWYTLTNLQYSKFGIYVKDNRLQLHLTSGGSQTTQKDRYSYYTSRTEHLDSFAAFGISLSNGLTYQKQIDFGFVPIGSFRDTMIRLRNLGEDTIPIAAFTQVLDSNYDITVVSNSLRNLPPDSECSLTIRYQPRSAIATSASVLNNPPTFLIQVSGTSATSGVSGVTSSNAFTVQSTIAGTVVDFTLPCAQGSLTILSNIGHILYHERISEQPDVNVCVEDWPNGTYFAMLQTAAGVQTAKFIVQH